MLAETTLRYELRIRHHENGPALRDEAYEAVGLTVHPDDFVVEGWTPVTLSPAGSLLLVEATAGGTLRTGPTTDPTRGSSVDEALEEPRSPSWK